MSSPGVRSRDSGGTSTHTSGKPHASYIPSLRLRTSVVWSTSSTTSGSGSSSTSIAGPDTRDRLGCRCSASSAWMSESLLPAASNRARSAEPKLSIRDPRSDSIRSASRPSRRAGRSW